MRRLMRRHSPFIIPIPPWSPSVGLCIVSGHRSDRVAGSEPRGARANRIALTEPSLRPRITLLNTPEQLSGVNPFKKLRAIKLTRKIQHCKSDRIDW
jgi:hypothetical protein